MENNTENNMKDKIEDNIEFYYPVKVESNKYEVESTKDGVFSENEDCIIYNSDIVFQTMQIEAMHECIQRRKNENYKLTNFNNLLKKIELVNKKIFLVHCLQNERSREWLQREEYLNEIIEEYLNEIIEGSRKLAHRYVEYMENKEK